MYLNSWYYLFLFLPLVVIAYYAMAHIKSARWVIALLMSVSLLYYGFLRPLFLAIFLFSAAVNFLMSLYLHDREREPRKRMFMLIAALAFNLIFLIYFKYASVSVASVQHLYSEIGLRYIAFPVGVSFYTFRQISFIIDTWRGTTAERDVTRYLASIFFFPQVVMGPMPRHHDLAAQMDNTLNRTLHWETIAQGLFLIAIGLFKKAVIGDRLGAWSSPAFDSAGALNFFEAWSAAIAYTFRIYFDFSGYSDMSIGSALLFNIRLPDNFNSPYQALNPADFWKRWHITLMNFFRDYLYIPMGGNRLSAPRQAVLILFIFTLSCLWHGASLNFILWGILWGVAVVIHRQWRSLGWPMPRFTARILMALFIIVSWVPFRASTFHDTEKIYRGMLGLSGVILPIWAVLIPPLRNSGITIGNWMVNLDPNSSYLLWWMVIAAIICYKARNSMELAARLRPNLRWAAATAVLLAIGLLHLAKVSEFIYLRF